MEDFVTFELAKKLKEKGFRYNTSYWYNQFGALLNKDENDRKSKNSVLTNDKSYGVDSPTISQVVKWLREEKRIDTGAVWDNRDGKWVGYINEMDMPDLLGEYVLPNTHDTYEAATIASIEYVLDNLI